MEKYCLLQSYIILEVYNKDIYPSTLPIIGRKQGGFRPNKMHTMNSYIWCRCIATRRYNKDQQLRCLKELFREIHRGQATSHISSISASGSAVGGRQKQEVTVALKFCLQTFPKYSHCRNRCCNEISFVFLPPPPTSLFLPL